MALGRYIQVLNETVMKILLITDVPPCKEFSGALLTDQMCRLLPRDSIVAFIPINPYLRHIKMSEDLNWIPTKYIDKPREDASSRICGRLGAITKFFSEMYNAKIKTKIIKKQAVAFGKLNDVDRVWCILQGQTTIRLALSVARDLEVPLHTQIWDHPQWWLRENNVDRINSIIVMKAFGNAIRNSAYCAAASPEMAEDFERKYNVPSIPVLSYLKSDAAYSPEPVISEKETISIGVAGQLYSYIEWQTLIAALDEMNWEFNGRNLIVRYLGYYLNLDLRGKESKKVNIQFLGYRSQEETINILSHCDIMYCPYPFSTEFEIIARTSFPAKLTTYLAAGRPIFFHGPEYASPARFLKCHHAGMLCHTLKIEEIVRSLSELIVNRGLYKELSINGSRAFRSHLTTKNLRANLSKFFNFE